jgi:hypothetical protein
MLRKLTAATVLAGGLLVGCGADPCDSLPRPSQAEIADHNQGRPIEDSVRQGNEWVECEWDSGWHRDD